MKLYLLSVILGCGVCYGFIAFSQNKNSEDFKRNESTVSPHVYKQHKSMLTDSIKKYVCIRSHAFYPKENDSLTEVVIDTILYSPQKDKAAFFVVTKNSNDKLLSKGSKDEYHYNGYCFIALINNCALFRNIQWLSVSSISNFDNYKETQGDIRKMYFEDFKYREDYNGNAYKYNIGDIRFWDCSIWNK
jgi:hypothetical protein